jgi:prepilin-type processing-associated H-X9-DG protein
MNSLLESEDQPFYRMGSTPKESQTVFIFDGRVDNSGVRSQVKGTWAMAAARHKGATNLLFLDCHVQPFAAKSDGTGWKDSGPFIWDPFK